jgi:hypothetical protein
MGTMTLIATVIGSIALGLLSAWLRSELLVWHEPLIKFLVRRAARSMPEEIRVEAEAEWLAWINDVRSPTMKLIQAASLSYCSFKLAIASRSSTAVAFRSILADLGPVFQLAIVVTVISTSATLVLGFASETYSTSKTVVAGAGVCSGVSGLWMMRKYIRMTWRRLRGS